MSYPKTLTFVAANLTNEVADVNFVLLDESGGVKSTFRRTDKHSDAARYLLDVKRQAPKRSGDNLGVRKSAIKLTIDEDVALRTEGTVQSAALMSLDFNVPVGLSSETVTTMIEIMSEMLVSYKASFIAQATIGDINVVDA